MMINLGIPLTKHCKLEKTTCLYLFIKKTSLICHLPYLEYLWKSANYLPFSSIDPWKKDICRKSLHGSARECDQNKSQVVRETNWLRCVPKFGERSPHGNSGTTPRFIRNGHLRKVGAQRAQFLPAPTIHSANIHSSHTSTWICTTYSKLSFGMILTCPHSFTLVFCHSLIAMEKWSICPFRDFLK